MRVDLFLFLRRLLPISASMLSDGSRSGIRAAGIAALGLAAWMSPLAAAERFDAEQRLACHIALEDVRWEARIWPPENPNARPARHDILPDSEIQARIERSLQMEDALRELYGVVIEAKTVQAEIERILRASRAPATLADLLAALDHDPQRIAECLARPLLVERRLRNAYARDHRWHGELLDSIKAELGGEGSIREIDTHFILEHDHITDDAGQPLPEQAWAKQPFDLWWEQTAMQWPVIDRPLRGQFHLAVEQLDARSSSDPGAWLLRDHPEGRYRHTAIWTGSEMIIWGGQAGSYLDSGARYDPATDSWTGISRRGAPIPRAGHVAVWTGDRMVIWGGTNGTRLNSGGRYDPLTDTWTSTSLIDAPQQRESATAVWTGNEMIVWGGTFNGSLDTGGRYDPVANTWAATSQIDAPEARTSHSAVWTGEEMLVWGGQASSTVRLSSGSRYDPQTDTWTPTTETGAPSPRTQHGAVWADGEMLVWGGWSGTSLNTGGRYDPTTDSWVDITQTGAPSARSTPATVWTGQAMVVWSGIGGGITGGRYEPATDSWLSTSTTSAPEQASNQSWIWTGEEMIIWGGWGFLDSGARYNPMLDQWVATGTSGAPSRRAYFAGLWTGVEWLVWGGATGNLYLNDGGAWDAATDSWRPLPAIPDLAGRAHVTGVWTGTELMVWGGQTGSITRANDGARLNLVTEQWDLLSESGAPEARLGHTAVWTGSEMIIWGGRASDFLGNGARYLPATDSWLPVSNDFAADARESHTAIWSGSEMIIWGGWRNAVLDTGGRYVPATDSWLPVTLTGAPSARRLHSVVWTGSEMIIWGGGTSHFTGGRYDPLSNTWTATATSGAPLGRGQHTAVWTGEEMIVWGGFRSSALNSGARYDPLANTWTATTVQGAPGARYRHGAAWTGDEMLVWGGCCTFNSLGRYLPDSPPEPPLVVISGLSPSPSLVNSNVLINIEVSDPVAESWPGDGQVVVQASSGESCTDAGPPGFSAGAAQFACQIEFNMPGQRELVAFFSQSQDFEDSDSSLQQVVHQVLTEFTYSVGGEVNGLQGSGLVLVNNEDDELEILADGTFQFPTELPDGSTYTVSVFSQPEDPIQFCQVLDGDGMISGADVNNVLVQCSTDFFSVGGQVSGLQGSGLVLRINGDEVLEIDEDGQFVFPTLLPDGASYAVSVLSQPSQPNQTCGINGASGLIDGSDIDDIQVTCITNTYTVGGTVTGMLGEGLVLQNNGSDDLPVSDDGSFTFATSLPDGHPYAVTVLNHPTQPEQDCSVSLGNGQIAGSNITGVQVNCQLSGFQVTPWASAGGTIDPDLAQWVELNETASFELFADEGHVLIGVEGSCGGQLNDAIYTTDPVVADCTVEARFARISVTTLQIDPAPAQPGQTVNLTATVSVVDNVPEGSEVLITASSGESCLADQGTLDGQTLVFDCQISFVNPGERSLVADYPGSDVDAPSSSVAQWLQVANLVDVTVTMEPLQLVANAGETVDWLVELRNLGPDPATLVMPDWQMSPQAEFMSWVCLALPDSDCPEDQGTGTLPAELALPAGGGLDLVISTELPNALPPQVLAVMTVNVGEEPPDYLLDLVPENNLAEAWITVDAIFHDRFQ